MEELKEYLQKLEEKYKNLQELKRKCSWCGKERKVESGNYYSEYFFCSEECKAKKNEVERKRKIETEIRSKIPRKFWEINTGKKDLLNTVYKKSVFCYGGVGTGKSVFIADLAKKYISEDILVMWISYPAFIMRLRNLYKKENPEKTPWDIAESVAKFGGILFLDDLGAEQLTEFVREITYFILNEREQRVLITVITSNFSLDQLDEYIDPRISSRIAGMCEVLKFTGEDRRVKKQQRR